MNRQAVVSEAAPQPNGWDQLPFWLSEDWLRIQERLHDREDAHTASFCPCFNLLFKALDVTPLESTKVAIVGQDPYPNPANATGLAFSIPHGASLTPSLRIIFKEYSDDLHLPTPVHGDLSSWCGSNGVLLWNSLATCDTGKSLSHDWPEWRRLTDDILDACCRRGTCIVLVGGIARRHAETVHYNELLYPGQNVLIEVSHPSPRGIRSSSNPFVGSRIFSKINAGCVSLGHEPVAWELPR